MRTTLVCALFVYCATSFNNHVAAGETWDGGGANDNWSNGLNWNDAGMFKFPPPNNGTANIVMPSVGGLVQTPIVNVPYSINSLTFNNGDGRFVILAAEELTIGAGGVTNNDADVQSVIGPVKLSADQTWTTAAGPLQIDAVNLNGFELSVAGAFPIDLSGPISDSGNNEFAFVLTVPDTYPGQTFVNGGTLLLNKSAGAVAIPESLSVLPGGTVRLGADEQFSNTSTVSLSYGGLLDLNGHTGRVGTLVLTGDQNSTTMFNTGAGKLVVGEGINNFVDFYSAAGPGFAYPTIAGNFDLGGGNPLINGGEYYPLTYGTRLTIDGVLSNGSVSFSGSTRLTGAANTYIGQTVVGGTLRLAKPGVDGALRGDVTIQGILILEANEQILAKLGNEVFVNGGDLNLSGYSETIQDLRFNNDGSINAPGSLTVLGLISATSSSSNSISAALNLAGTRTFDVQGSSGLTVSGAVSNGTIVKTGTGTLTLNNAANTYAGGTFLNQGTVSATSDATLGNPAGGLHFDGGTLGANGTSFTSTARTITWGPNGGGFNVTGAAGVFTLSQSLSGPGPLTKLGSGKLVLAAPQSYMGGTTLAGGVISVSSDANLGDAAGPLRFNGGTLRVTGAFGTTPRTVELLAGGGGLDIANDAASFTYAGNVTGPGGITKLGAGLLELSGNNSYGGATTISAGVLRTAGGQAIPDGSAVTLASAASAMLDLADTSETIGSLAGGGPAGGNVDMGTGTLTTGGNNASTAYAGVISGSGGVVKTGTGTWTLSGSNTYTGGTTVAAGTLEGDTQSLQGNIVDNGTVAFNQASDGTYAGNLSGTGALTKLGTAALLLTANNTYSGATAINAGTLRLGNTTGIGALSAVTVANVAGAMFDLNDLDATIGSLAGGGPTGGNVVLGSATLTTGGDNSSTTFAGAITGAGGLTKTGAGVLRLAGNNTYAGLTDVQQGTLELAAATGVPDNTAVHIAGGATVDLAGFDKSLSSLTGEGLVALGAAELTLGANDASSTFGGDIAGSGSVVKTGADTVTLDGVNSYSGGTTVLAGTLRGPAGGLQGDIVNQSVVEFAQAVDGTYNGTLSGPGELVKTGPGRTTIAAPAMYTGTTTVAAGTLALPNTLNSPGGAITLEAAGTLEASGVFQRSITGDGALAAIGNLLAGDLTSASGFDAMVHVGSHSVVLADADVVDLRGGTIAGGSLTTLGGLDLTGTFAGYGTVNGPLVNNGVVAGPVAPAALSLTGPVSGPGSFTGHVRILDSYAPGNSPAAVSWEDATFGNEAVLTIDVNGLAAGTEYDQLNVSGSATLAGVLDIVIDPLFAPQPGDSFTILTYGSRSGEFNAVSGVGLISGNAFLLPVYDTNELRLVALTPGDANGDGHVDGLDYLIWAGNYGDDPADDPPGSPANGDFNDDNVVNGPDYVLWASNYLQGPNDTVAVPEPAACALFLIGAMTAPLFRRSRMGETLGKSRHDNQ
jgi:autotransporter-associated beta strand protein